MQEDPLYAIKKKEMESKNQLLKNPVKLKQLKELVNRKVKIKYNFIIAYIYVYNVYIMLYNVYLYIFLHNL